MAAHALLVDHKMCKQSFKVQQVSAGQKKKMWGETGVGLSNKSSPLTPGFHRVWEYPKIKG
jgi:hypothetical protein